MFSEDDIDLKELFSKYNWENFIWISGGILHQYPNPEGDDYPHTCWVAWRKEKALKRYFEETKEEN